MKIDMISLKLRWVNTKHAIIFPGNETSKQNPSQKYSTHVSGESWHCTCTCYTEMRPIIAKGNYDWRLIFFDSTFQKVLRCFRLAGWDKIINLSDRDDSITICNMWCSSPCIWALLKNLLRDMGNKTSKLNKKPTHTHWIKN